MIIDTNALSAFIDGDEAVGALLLSAKRAALPVIVLGEFRYGIRQSRHRKAYEGWLAANLSGFEVLTVSESTTHAYATVRAELKRLGEPIPANDAWIAALAFEHGLPILSRDRHFDAVPNVQRRQW